MRRRTLAAFGVVVAAASAPLGAGKAEPAGNGQGAPFQFGVPAPEQPFTTPVIPLDPSKQSPSDPIAPKQTPFDPTMRWVPRTMRVDYASLAMAGPCFTMRIIPLDPSIDPGIHGRYVTPQAQTGRIVPKAPCVTPGVQRTPVSPSAPK